MSKLKCQMPNKIQSSKSKTFMRKIKIFVLLIFILFPFASSNAVFTDPTVGPPNNGDIYQPIYVTSPSGQSISNGLEVSSGGFTSTVSSGTAIQGSGPIGVKGASGSVSAIYGEQLGTATSGYRAVYGKVVSSDDYAGLFEGIVNVNALIELSSGAGQGIRFLYKDTGISWPDNTSPTPVDLFGIYVKASNNALRLVGHGGGVEVTDKSLNVRLSVSEAGVVNVASGGALQVNGVNVCLADGTNCSVSASGGGWTDDGAIVRLSTIGDSVGVGTISPEAKLDAVINDTPVTADSANYYTALQATARTVPIAAGVTDSGYRIGLRAESYVDKASFAGILADQRALWARAGANSSNPPSGSRIINSYAV
ncbi:MAG: hypothetical protein CO042_01560, partial [Parcubacteria group bacterium CG_4_9_14_0_2_um_filter_41_8]